MAAFERGGSAASVMTALCACVHLSCFKVGGSICKYEKLTESWQEKSI